MSDFLQGLGYKLVSGIGFELAFTTSLFEKMETTEQVSEQAAKLRDAMVGPAEVDPEFRLGAVIDCSTNPPKRHHHLEIQSAQVKITSGTVTLQVSPQKGLSAEELAKWEAAHKEQDYQAKLEAQRAKLEPAFREPRAVKVLELLNRDEHTGETLYKIYELAEGHPSNRTAFHAQFGVSKADFERFKAVVHKPKVSGDWARHAYIQGPRPNNPMTKHEAETFVRRLAEKWLASLR